MEEVIKLSLGGLQSYLARRAYMRSLYRLMPKRRFAEMTLLGERVTIDRQDLEQVYLETDCVREPENVFIYRALAKSGLCHAFVDVGANYGHVASKVYEHFRQVVLVDANPSAAHFLDTVFAKQAHVKVVNCALVESDEIEKVTLMVSESSSGLAHVASSSGAFQRSDERAFECGAMTLQRLLETERIESAYVKIDVEGFEPGVIKGGGKSLQRPGFIVGFEALSKEIASECCRLFDQHTFYFARLNFLDSSGALTRSVRGILRSLLGGGAIAIYRTDSIDDVPLSNFSQIVAVPNGLTGRFEDAMKKELAACGGRIDLH